MSLGLNELMFSSVIRIYFRETEIKCRRWLIFHIYNMMLNSPILIDMTHTTTLPHWGPVRHICVCYLTIIGSDNGLSPGRRQAIIWTYAFILLIGPLGKNFNESSVGIHTGIHSVIHFKISSGKWRPFCLGWVVNYIAIILEMFLFVFINKNCCLLI